MKIKYWQALLIILLPILLFFHTHGTVIHDEGYILNSSQKILEGYLPYRDFHFVYTPGTLYLTALSFLILTSSILSSRILMVLISLLTCFLIYKLIVMVSKSKLYATIAVLIYVAWGPTHINFSWPIMFAIPSALLTCYLLLLFTDREQERFLYLAGIMSFIVFLFKQNFGVGILLPAMVYFLVIFKKHKSAFMPFIYGYVWSFIVFSIYLLMTNSYATFVNDMYFFTVQRILINSRLTTSFIYMDKPVMMILRTLFYLLPLIFSTGAIILIIMRRRFKVSILPLFVIIFYILGIRPTTDYVHLVPLLAITGISIAILLRLNINPAVRYLTLLFSLAMIFLGFYTSLFKGYYRWDQPLIYQNKFFSNKRVNIFISDKFDNWFPDIITTTNKLTKPGSSILVNSYNPMIYFITQRQEPTKSNILTTEINQNAYYDEVLYALVGKRVPLLFLNKDDMHNLPQPLKAYINKNYKYVKTIGDFDIYERVP